MVLIIKVSQSKTLSASYIKFLLAGSKTSNTFQNRNVIMSYTLRTFTTLLQHKIGRKVRVFNLGRKNSITKKTE